MTNIVDVIWFKRHFGADIAAAVARTPFTVNMLTALACQETGYIWSTLRRRNLPLDRLVALCVGDVLDDRSSPPRGQFPVNKQALLAEPEGQAMFDIARAALEDITPYFPDYARAAANPDRFCRGYGIFQRDLQFFLEDPAYFLNRRYEVFSNTLDHALNLLKEKSHAVGLEGEPSLSKEQFNKVAIAYNRGRYNLENGLRQGHKSDGKYYGEWIDWYQDLCLESDRRAWMTPRTGRFTVAVSNHLMMRTGPGREYETSTTLQRDETVTILGFGGADDAWARVDRRGDGGANGYVHAAYLRSEDPS